MNGQVRIARELGEVCARLQLKGAPRVDDAMRTVFGDDSGDSGVLTVL